MEYKINQEQLKMVYNFINKGIYNLESGVIRQVYTILETLPKIEAKEVHEKQKELEAKECELENIKKIRK